MSFNRGMAILTGLICVGSDWIFAAEEKRPVTFEDVMSIRAVSEPEVSPDGANRMKRQYEWIARHTLGAASGAAPTSNGEALCGSEC